MKKQKLTVSATIPLTKSKEKEVENAEERAKRAQARRKKSVELLLLAKESSGQVDKVIQTDAAVIQCVSRGTQVEMI